MMLKNYFTIAWRNLIRNKVYAAINISGLALGISACLIIYLVSSFELSYDNFHPDKERIYRVVADSYSAKHGQNHSGSLPDPATMALRNEIAGFESIALFYNYDAKVTIPAGKLPVRKFDYPKWGVAPSDMIITEPQYFDIFKYQWLAGNAATALQAPFTVVLTESKAYKYFGKKPVDEIMGKTIIYNDSLLLTVSGIVKDFGKNTNFFFRDFISFSTIHHSFLKNILYNNTKWDGTNIGAQTFVKLSKGTTAAQVNALFPAFVKKHMPATGDWKTRYLLQPLPDLHFNNDYKDLYSRKAHLPTLYGLMGIAAFILIIAVINFINLSTAQSVERAKEIGVRKVLGSNRAGLIFQFLSETFILTLLAVIGSLAGMQFLLIALRDLLPEGVSLSLFSTFTCMFLLLITVCTTLLAGFYPARVLSSWLPALSLKGTGIHKGNHGYLRKGLVVFQFTISLVFIIGTLVIGRQLQFLLHKDLGFTKDAIIAIDKKDRSPFNKHKLLAERIRQLPEVEMVSISEGTPAAKQHFHLPLIYHDGKKTVTADCQPEWGDEHFIPLYRLKLIAGRNVLPSDTIKEILINETCAKALGFAKPEDAVGKFVETFNPRFDGSFRTCPIVGVMADFHLESLYTPITPTFLSTVTGFSWCINIKLRTQGKQISDFKTTLAKIEKLWNDTYPDEAFAYDFFDKTLAGFYEKEQKTARLMNIAMAITIFISCMGLFGLAAFTARQRTKEIGIRKVLGASVGSIVTLLSKDFLVLVLIAVVVASPIAWYFMQQWLANFAYRIAISWWMFLIAGVIAVAIALATVGFQAVKAAVVNPVKSLKAE